MNTQRLTTTCVRQVVDLTIHERDELFRLMQKNYRGVRRNAFERDLEEKQWVIVVNDSEGVLRGFSTQMLLASREFADVDALFSGDTIVDPAWWNQHDLSGVWGQLALSLIDRQPDRQLFWFLISKGYKTYRYLPLFFQEYYPRYDQTTPEFYERLLRSLGQQKFGERFDAVRGVVQAHTEDYTLRKSVASVSDHRLTSPHVQFFIDRNPNYASGDELCCIAPLTRGNFTKAAYRVMAAVQL